MAGDRSARLMSLAFVSAGVAHFARPGFFEAIVPRWVPDAPLANKVTGAAEIVLGAAMAPRATRRFAAKGLMVLLVVVFPANVDMAIHDVDVKPDEAGVATRIENAGTGPRNWIRLPFQFLLMAWAWTHARRVRPTPAVSLV